MMNITGKSTNKTSTLSTKKYKLIRAKNKVKAAIKRFICGVKPIIKIIGKVFKGAILFAALVYFIPEIREQLPAFYTIVDMVVSVFENICFAIIQIFRWLLQQVLHLYWGVALTVFVKINKLDKWHDFMYNNKQLLSKEIKKRFIYNV